MLVEKILSGTSSQPLAALESNTVPVFRFRPFWTGGATGHPSSHPGKYAWLRPFFFFSFLKTKLDPPYSPRTRAGVAYTLLV